MAGDKGTRIKIQGTRIRDQGTSSKNQVARIKGQGSTVEKQDLSFRKQGSGNTILGINCCDKVSKAGFKNFILQFDFCWLC